MISDCANFLAVCFWSSDLIPLGPSLHLQEETDPFPGRACGLRAKLVRRAPGCMDSWHAKARSLQSLVPCARRFAAWAQSGRARRAAGSLQGGVRVGAERGSPRSPLPALGARAIGPDSPVGGRMTSAAGWIIKKREQSRGLRSTQPAPRSTGTRDRIAARPDCSALACRSARRPRAPSLPSVCAPERPGTMLHLSQLLACALLLSLLSLRPSEAEPGRRQGGCCRGDVQTCAGGNGRRLGCLGGRGAPG